MYHCIILLAFGSTVLIVWLLHSSFIFFFLIMRLILTLSESVACNYIGPTACSSGLRIGHLCSFPIRRDSVLHAPPVAYTVVIQSGFFSLLFFSSSCCCSSCPQEQLKTHLNSLHSVLTQIIKSKSLYYMVMAGGKCHQWSVGTLCCCLRTGTMPGKGVVVSSACWLMAPW